MSKKEISKKKKKLRNNKKNTIKIKKLKINKKEIKSKTNKNGQKKKAEKEKNRNIELTEYKNICMILNKCDIEEIAHLLIKEGNLKDYPDLNTR